MTSGGKRPGSGAPKKPEPKKRVKTSIQIQKWMLDIINTMATDRNISRSMVIESIIQGYIARHKIMSGNF